MERPKWQKSVRLDYIYKYNVGINNGTCYVDTVRTNMADNFTLEMPCH